MLDYVLVMARQALYSNQNQKVPTGKMLPQIMEKLISCNVTTIINLALFKAKIKTCV